MEKQIRFLKLKNIADTSMFLGYLHKIYMKTKIKKRFKKLNLNDIRFAKGVRLNVLGIEFTNVCDLYCIWCPLDRKNTGFMKIELLKKILDEVVKNENKIENIALHHSGETTLHPRLEEMLNLVGEYKRKNQNFPKVALLTNANQLTKEKSKIIINSNAIDWMRFSVDGGNKEDFEHIRKGAKWETVIENIHNFLNIKPVTITTSIFTLLKDKKNFSEEFLKLVSRVDEHKILFPGEWRGDIKVKNKINTSLSKREVGGCPRVLGSMDILWNGRVAPCNIDLNGKGVIGNLNESTLLEVYKGEKRIDMLDKMKQRKRFEINLCKNCRDIGMA